VPTTSPSRWYQYTSFEKVMNPLNSARKRRRRPTSDWPSAALPTGWPGSSGLGRRSVSARVKRKMQALVAKTTRSTKGRLPTGSRTYAESSVPSAAPTTLKA